MDYLQISELYHHGIKGMKWGVRRFQNEDGSLTELGKKRYVSEYTYYDKKDPRKSYEAHKSMVVSAVANKAIKAEDIIRLRSINDDIDKVMNEKDALLMKRSKTNLKKQEQCLEAYVDYVYGKDAKNRQGLIDDAASYDEIEGVLMNPKSDSNLINSIQKQANQGNKEAINLLNQLNNYQNDPESIKISKLMNKELELNDSRIKLRKQMTESLLGKLSTEKISWGMVDYEEAVQVANNIMKQK